MFGVGLAKDIGRICLLQMGKQVGAQMWWSGEAVLAHLLAGCRAVVPVVADMHGDLVQLDRHAAQLLHQANELGLVEDDQRTLLGREGIGGHGQRLAIGRALQINAAGKQVGEELGGGHMTSRASPA